MSAIQQLQETSQSVMIATLSQACDCTIMEKFEIELDSNYEFTNATCLAIAVLRDDTAAVETSLEKGCHVNYGQIECKIIQSMPVPDENEGGDEYRLTPLIMACRWSSLPVVALLIGHPGTETDKKNCRGDTALSWAVRKPGNLDMVRLLVQAGANVCSRDSEGYSCLYRAVEGGTLDIVKYLHSKGASLTTHAGSPNEHITPLLKAVSEGNHPIVRYLAENGAILVMPQFHEAVMYGNVEIVKYMIDQGVDGIAKNGSGLSPIDSIIESAQSNMSRSNVLEEDKKNYEEIISMVKAAEADFKRDEVIKLCDCSIMKKEFEIQREGDEATYTTSGVNHPLLFKNLSCLSIAVLQDDTEAVKASLKKGCDVNFNKTEVIFCDAASPTGFTPLKLACMHSSLPIVSLLLQQPGLEMDKVNEGWRYEVALSWAVRRKDNLDMVKLMVEAGADPDMRDFDGYSHLHRAVSHGRYHGGMTDGRVDNVQYLQSKGADVNTKHKFGLTPLWEAATHGDLAMVKYLANHGAFLKVPSSKGGYYYPLQAAVSHGHVDVVRFLIQQGDDIGESNLEIAQRSLHAAVEGGHVDVVRFLIKQGADVNWKSGSKSNLEIAQRRYQVKYPGSEKVINYDHFKEIISMLKEAGAKEADNKPED